VTGQYTDEFAAVGESYSVSIPIHNLVVFEEGVHRFEVGIDWAFITRVPFTVIRVPIGKG
jgi:hypothetical protein